MTRKMSEPREIERRRLLGITTQSRVQTAHAAPQYFLRVKNEVGRNFLQDDFLGLPEHT